MGLEEFKNLVEDASQRSYTRKVYDLGATDGSPSGNWTFRIETNNAGVPSGTLANANDLSTLFTEQEVVDVSASDDVRVAIEGEHYLIEQFKDYVGVNASCSLHWEGRSTLAPSVAPVRLQIFNYVSGLWVTVDTDSTSPADTDFVLEAYIVDLSEYKDSDIITCRVYQFLD